MKIIETERLVLCEQSVDDAAFILELINSPGWLKYIGDRGVTTIDAAKLYIGLGAMESYKKNGFGLYLVKLKNGNIPAGICGLIKRAYLEHVDIGFAFLDAFTGQGYAYESAAAVMRYGREVLGLGNIAAITIPGNEPSIKLLNKIGLQFKRMIIIPSDNEELMLFESGDAG